MQNHKVDPSSLWAWIFAGVSAPLAQGAGRSSWLTVLITGVVCGAACLWVLAAADKRCFHAGWYSAVQTLWLALVTGVLARWSVMCWPTADGFPVVGLTLLVLAVFASWGGAQRASRCISALFWLLALLYAVILAAGTQDLNLRYMTPTAQPFSVLPVVLFLLPVVAGFLPCTKRRKIVPLVGVSLFATVLSLWTIGTLSAKVTAQLKEPFYAFSRSLTLFGVAERFESVVSVALTMGYFSLFTFLLCAVYHLTDRVFPGKGRTGVVAAAILALTLMMLVTKISEMILAAGCVLLWVLLPLALGRKTKKLENWD